MAEQTLQPTPRNKLLGIIADALSATSSPQRTQQMQGMAQMLGIPALAKTANTLSYGGSLTSGKGMTTQLTPETKDALSVLLENLPVPSGKAAAAVGGAGIIAPATKEIASTLNIEKIVDRVMNMAREGKSWWKIGTESEKALREARNPGGALSIFIGPEGIPRIKIDPAVASIAKSAPVKEMQDAYGKLVKLAPEMQAQGQDWLGPEIPLSDILMHPSLYDISPGARTATVQHNLMFDLTGGGAGYVPSTNTIQLGSTQAGPARIANDPMGYLLETLLHEPTHIIQAENKLRGGGAPTADSVRQALNEALSKGSYRSPAEIQQLQDYLTKIEAMPDSARKQSMLDNLYMSNYGEWEARQASQYGRSLPMYNEKGATY